MFNWHEIVFSRRKVGKCRCLASVEMYPYDEKPNFWVVFDVLPGMLRPCRCPCWIASPILDISQKN